MRGLAQEPYGQHRFDIFLPTVLFTPDDTNRILPPRTMPRTGMFMRDWLESAFTRTGRR